MLTVQYFSGSNDYSATSTNGYQTGGGYGTSTNGYGGGAYGGGGYGGAGGDKMSNLGAGLKTQRWGKSKDIAHYSHHGLIIRERSGVNAEIRKILLQGRPHSVC